MDMPVALEYRSHPLTGCVDRTHHNQCHTHTRHIQHLLPRRRSLRLPSIDMCRDRSVEVAKEAHQPSAAKVQVVWDGWVGKVVAVVGMAARCLKVAAVMELMRAKRRATLLSSGSEPRLVGEASRTRPPRHRTRSRTDPHSAWHQHARRIALRCSTIRRQMSFPPTPRTRRATPCTPAHRLDCTPRQTQY